MVTENDVKFGWIPTPPERRNMQAALYGWKMYFPTILATVEKITTLDPQFRTWYDQDGKNACVGASWSQIMATINLPQIGAQHYDWWKIYCQACADDGDNQTSCQADIGTFVYAGGDVLRKYGPYVYGKTWDLEQGIDNYLWAYTVDGLRSAIGEGQLASFGMPWFDVMMTPVLGADGRYHFPPRSKWKKQVGGHDIGIYDALDSIQAFGFVNTWGKGFPEKVYMDYNDWQYLVNTLGAECAVAIDRSFTPPIPPEPPVEHTVSVVVTVDDVNYPFK